MRVDIMAVDLEVSEYVLCGTSCKTIHDLLLWLHHLFISTSAAGPNPAHNFSSSSEFGDAKTSPIQGSNPLNVQRVSVDL